MDYLTVREAAEALGITERAVRWRLENGLIKGEKAGGWMWMIQRADVEQAQKIPPTKGRPPTPRGTEGTG